MNRIKCAKSDAKIDPKKCKALVIVGNASTNKCVSRQCIVDPEPNSDFCWVHNDNLRSGVEVVRWNPDLIEGNGAPVNLKESDYPLTQRLHFYLKQRNLEQANIIQLADELLQDLSSVMEKKEKEIESLLRDVDHFREIAKQEKEEAAYNKKEIVNLNTQLTKASQRLAQLKAGDEKQKLLAQEIASLQKQLKEKTEATSVKEGKLQHELEAALNEVKALKTQLNESKIEIATLTKRIEEGVRDVQATRDEVKRLEKDLLQSKNEDQKVQAQRVIALEELRTELERTKGNLKDSTNALREEKKNYQELQLTLTEQIESLKKRVQEAETGGERKVEGVTEKLREAQLQYERKEAELAEKTKELDALKERLAEATTQLNQFREQNVANTELSQLFEGLIEPSKSEGGQTQNKLRTLRGTLLKETKEEKKTPK